MWGGGTVAPVQVLPLRTEQETEPLARRRFNELQSLSAEAIRAELERARQAGFATTKMVRRHTREHAPSFGLESQDAAAYLALAEDIKRNPERLFSAYYGTDTRPAVKQWFTRANLLAVVAEYPDGFVLTTFYRAILKRGSTKVITLDEYLRGRDHGRKMVEVKL